MRKVKVFEWKKFDEAPYNRQVEAGEATFHQFGVDYEEFETGAGNYSTAIVEFSDGRVGNIPVSLIQFVEEKPDCICDPSKGIKCAYHAEADI